jgi:CRISPR-associated protein Csd1
VILQSLVNYYEILNRAGEISKPGYSIAKVSFGLNISESGSLLSVIPLRKSNIRGEKTVELPQLLQVPEQGKRAVNILPNFLCDNSKYLLGIDSKGNTERVKQCFESARQLHINILKNVECVEAKAVVSFFENWETNEASENVALFDCFEQISSGANLAFIIESHGFAQDCIDIQDAWINFTKGQEQSTIMQCLVTGENKPVAVLHPNIKGVRGAQSMGASLVSFNAPADWSYCRDDEQGLNAPVSEYAAFAYTTTLNHLLSDSDHRCSMGDTTIVYWANSCKTIYRDLFGYAIEPQTENGNDIDEQVEDISATKLVKAIFNKIVDGSPISEVAEYFDKDTSFFVLGLSPNAARLSVRFFMQDSFGSFIEKIISHYKNLEIDKAPFEPRLLPVWKLLLETVSPNSKDKASSPLLSGAVFRSIFTGSVYPTALFSNVIVRIRAEKNISYGKAAIIKAFLIRKYENEEKIMEVLSVSLNENSKNKAYILGRLFAVLEKLQQEANPGINTTIKDKYFTSACATPATVFPVLLRLSGHHSSKAQYGYTYENKIRDILDKIDMDAEPFPSHLSLDQQGVFILGYYQQYQSNYKKVNKED